jgi:MFS superfamily sulfate permease-like transporter
MLKEIVWGFSIALLLFFVGIVQIVAKSDFFIYWLLAGIFPLTWSILRYGKYAGLKPTHVICKKCNRHSQIYH